MKRPFIKLLHIMIIGLLFAVKVHSFVINFSEYEIPMHSVVLPKPPSIAVADHGFRHQLDLVYNGIIYYVILTDIEYIFTLLDGPAGMTLSEDGLLVFQSSLEQAGGIFPLRIQVDISVDDSLVYTQAFVFNVSVVATVPELVSFADPFFGRYSREKFEFGIMPELAESDEGFVIWSLIDPPGGVCIMDSGEITYPWNEYGEGMTELPIRLRYDLPALQGEVSGEVSFQQVLLPTPPSGSVLNTWRKIGTSAAANFGFSMDRDGDLLAVGEPFVTAESDVESGSVRVWRWDDQRNRLFGDVNVQSDIAEPGESFGASVAISAGSEAHSAVLAVGAPEASATGGELFFNVGRVEVFELDGDDVWQSVAQLPAPISQADLFFGGWVDVSEDTLIASMDGDSFSGQHTGALAVYHQSESGDWSWAQTLRAPVPGASDYFGYPSVVEGTWIAAAANEDDTLGQNTGAVHLYHEAEGIFSYRQTVYSPAPSSGALFGERVLLSDEWLLVSEFRRDQFAGAVHVYHLAAGFWIYQQTLEAPFVTPYSCFGAGLALDGDTMSVSATGHLAGEDDYPWTGVTLYRLLDDNWTWANQKVGDGDDGLGLSIAQFGSHDTIVGLPFSNWNRGRSNAGAIEQITWPILIPESADDALAQVNQLAMDDADGNGISNLLQWAMGESMDFHRISDFRGSQPFTEQVNGGLRYFMPPITRGVGLNTEVQASTDGQVWAQVKDARWEGLRYYAFQQNGVSFWRELQPIFIPWPEGEETLLLRVVLGTDAP